MSYEEGKKATVCNGWIVHSCFFTLMHRLCMKYFSRIFSKVLSRIFRKLVKMFGRNFDRNKLNGLIASGRQSGVWGQGFWSASDKTAKPLVLDAAGGLPYNLSSRKVKRFGFQGFLNVSY
jgi:hypothetical protein